MQLTDVFRSLDQDGFQELLRTVSIGKLKTYQLYGQLKARAGVPKLNVQGLRRVVPRFWDRVIEGDEELASDLAQAVLVSNLDMIIEMLDHLGVPHQDGFFNKDLDASDILKNDWQQRAFDHFRGKYPEALVLFYLNHLALELTEADELFSSARAG